MSNYGIPYMGSKAGIAPSICMNFPAAEHFYDLFGGGFSISHYMIENKSNKFKYFHYNEIKADIVKLVEQAINGDFNYSKFKQPWVSRKDFFANLDNAYIRCCWSFGNNQRGYLFGEDIEAYKKSLHMAIVFDEFDSLSATVLWFNKWPAIAKTIKQRRYYLSQKLYWFNKNKEIPKILYQFLSEKQLKEIGNKDNLQQLERLEQLARLERLQQLERLQRLQRLQRLTCTSKDYRQVEILPDSVVYCDIPYQGTSDYGEFNHKEFFDWAASRQFPVYISEYNVPDPRFKLIYDIDKRSILSANKYKCINKSEKLYWNKVSL